MASSPMSNSSAPVLTLDNCAQEPIHIPGRIQSHGSLFAFDPHGALLYRSTNADTLLGPGLPSLGDALSLDHFASYPGLHELLAQVRESPDDDVFGYAADLHGAFGSFNVVAHRRCLGHQGMVQSAVPQRRSAGALLLQNAGLSCRPKKVPKPSRACASLPLKRPKRIQTPSTG